MSFLAVLDSALGHSEVEMCFTASQSFILFDNKDFKVHDFLIESGSHQKIRLRRKASNYFFLHWAVDKNIKNAILWAVK